MCLSTIHHESDWCTHYNRYVYRVTKYTQQCQKINQFLRHNVHRKMQETSAYLTRPDWTKPQNEIPHPVRISCLQKFKNNVEEYRVYLTKKLQEHCLKWFQIQTKRKKIDKCPFHELVYFFWSLASFWTIIYWPMIYKKDLQYTNAS